MVNPIPTYLAGAAGALGGARRRELAARGAVRIAAHGSTPAADRTPGEPYVGAAGGMTTVDSGGTSGVNETTSRVGVEPIAAVRTGGE